MGSSPLARGLLAVRPRLTADARIIPARAGFTSAWTRNPEVAGDHPRSRGVYTRMAVSRTEMWGSSPLARGLLGLLVCCLRIPGIIPARAGFTRGARGGTPSRADHPRSRGVYGGNTLDVIAAGGSSPLARGLQNENTNTHTTARIIPARAGFTHGPSGCRWKHGDHPRSRGVYTIEALKAKVADGSSPLARGLHPIDGKQCSLNGIIPARAGFTPAASAPQATCPDHPRSRGVYTPQPVENPVDNGSSPLARGLPRKPTF